ncbi:uncharacterized protein BJ171DRAFT_596781 [Polychytrium aggregatum]|uniref:uncharacterized protein n=1 Tax=Polychytrium aggregatum TaxID=110093 RepID=UPI0022FE604A|nr:uncharacterized protein BJ171DRAFT_596781 [Polychytrium aggregatum]KAI9207202.1 hypothetical protein BJ171DRAFT_596781 [Polychytrium aggregatum]
MGLIFCSQANSVMCTIISAFGGVFLVILGFLYQAEVDELVEGKPDKVPSDPQAVGHACFMAAALYLILFLISLCQAHLNSRAALATRGFSGI